MKELDYKTQNDIEKFSSKYYFFPCEDPNFENKIVCDNIDYKHAELKDICNQENKFNCMPSSRQYTIGEINIIKKNLELKKETNNNNNFFENRDIPQKNIIGFTTRSFVKIGETYRN